MPEALSKHDNTPIYYETYGDKSLPAVFLGPHFYASAGKLMAEANGIEDPSAKWIDGLAENFYLILADLPRGMGKTGKPLGMAYTPDVVVADFCSVLDAAGVDRAAWVGYSYGGAVGVQMACRSDRLWAVCVGGFPPLHAPFELMVEITSFMAENPPAGFDVDEDLLWSSTGFYKPLVGWNEIEQLSSLSIPRMAFMGTDDRGQGLDAGGISGGAPLAENLGQAESQLKELGWQIDWIEGGDHLTTIAYESVGESVKAFLMANKENH